MGNRCLNDLFNYCDGVPKEGDKPTTSIIGLANGCVKDPATCKSYLRETEKDKLYLTTPQKGKTKDAK